MLYWCVRIKAQRSVAEAEVPREHAAALLARSLRLLGLLGVVLRGGHGRLCLFTDGNGDVERLALTVDLELQLVAGRLLADVADKVAAGGNGCAVDLGDDVVRFQTALCGRGIRCRAW